MVEEKKGLSKLEKWALGLGCATVISGSMFIISICLHGPYSFPSNLENYERFARIQNTLNYYENQEFPPRESDKEYSTNKNSKNRGLYVITEGDIDSLSLEDVQELKQEQKEILENDEETNKYFDRIRLSRVFGKGFLGVFLFGIPYMILAKKLDWIK